MISNEEVLNENQRKSNQEILQEAYEPKNHDPIQIQHDIDAAARRLADFSVESFYKKTGSSENNRMTGFERESQAICHAIELGEHIKNTHQSEVIKLPPQMLIEIASHLHDMDKILRMMRNFHEEENIKGLQPQIGDHIKNRRDQFSLQFYKTLEALKKSSGYLVSVTSIQEITALREQVNKLTDAQTQEGIEKHHELFSKNASRHHIAGWFWLFLGAALAGVAWTFGDSMIDKIEGFSLQDADGLTDVHLGLVFTRIFLFGFLATLIFWSFKNYRLNKHNELLNKQKALSIQTFTEFSNAAGTDADMRRAVLARVTSTIFDTPDMGYIKNEAASDKDGDILNVLANIMSKKES